MSRIDSSIATQVGDVIRPSHTIADRQNQTQAAQLLQADASADAPAADAVYNAAAQIKQVIEAGSSRRLSTDIDPDSKEVYMKITDPSTGEVIKQIPSKEVLSLHARLQKFVGLLLDKTA
jgi:flagellar protein FlaG